jgi:hypothetical protein
MQIILTPDELCTMAQSREKLNARVVRGVVVVTVALAAGLLYNVYRIDQPWLRLGQARQYEERRCGYLRIRRRLFLFIPGIAASWWGGGPLAAVNAWGLDPSSRLFHFCAGPWPFVMTGIALLLVWFAFGKAAEKAAHECAEVRRSIAH